MGRGWRHRPSLTVRPRASDKAEASTRQELRQRTLPHKKHKNVAETRNIRRSGPNGTGANNLTDIIKYAQYSNHTEVRAVPET